MSEMAWKRLERRVGAMIGLPRGEQREGPTGKSGLDVQNEEIGVQVKRRKRLPRLLVDALENAERCSTPKQHAVAVFSEHGWKDKELIVAMRLRDYLLLRNAADRNHVLIKKIAKDGLLCP